eukprot:TRINITY_DN6109_c0_g1_i1.p2 TRINITY_DN6109_c0_g1~~TRINITY_DN6109_c0_g1_i1.p2  ORF type:complete len:157 (-),score=31.25 TRINITY_DN6109_c0_g1_i1:1414-1884(-)
MAALVVESSSLDNIPTSNNNNSSNNNNNNNNNDKNVDGDDQGIDQNRGMRELVDLLSKLNPLAEEFVPHKGSIHQRKDDNNRLKFNGNASDSSGNSVSHFNSSENGNPTSSGRRVTAILILVLGFFSFFSFRFLFPAMNCCFSFLSCALILLLRSG